MKPLHETRMWAMLALLACPLGAAAQTPLGTAFTYQGKLNQSAAPAAGSFDFVFTLWSADTGGAQVGTSVCSDNVALTNGLFSVPLDFGGSAFTGDARWLEIAVRAGNVGDCSNATGYTTLTPRQPVTPAPHALYAARTANPLSLVNSLAAASVIRGQNDSEASNSAALEGVAAGGTGSTIGVSGRSSSLSGKGVFGLANYSFGGTPSGVYGQSDTSGGRGMTGMATLGSGTGTGGYFESAASNGTGVYGKATATTGNPFPLGIGVRGESVSLFGRGVYGTGTHTSGGNYGGYFETLSTAGVGVTGVAQASTGVNYGVRGSTNSASGYAAYFLGRGYFSGNVGIGNSSPTELLDVAGFIRSSSGGYKFPDATVQTTASPWQLNGNNVYYNNGLVGLGTSEPTAAIHIAQPYNPVAVRLQTSRYDSAPPVEVLLGPASAAVSGTGQSWTGAPNVLTSDDARATVSLAGSSTLPDTLSSQNLEVSNFGFNIPSDATIIGVAVHIEGSGTCSCTDCGTPSPSYPYNGCRVSALSTLVAGGAASATRSATLGSTESTISVGSSVDTFGMALTPAQVNASSFAVRLAAVLALNQTCISWFGQAYACPCECNGTGTASIDYVSVSIYYRPSAPVTTPVDWTFGVPQDDTTFLVAPTADLSTPALVVTTDKRLGIDRAPGTTGGMFPIPYKLDVNGRARCTLMDETSSRRFKTEIRPIVNAMKTLKRLEGVSYRWDAAHGSRPDLGFVAEQAAQAVPELVSWEADGTNAAGLRYSGITAVTVEAIKEQQREIDSLRRENRDLRERLERVEAALGKLAVHESNERR